MRLLASLMLLGAEVRDIGRQSFTRMADIGQSSVSSPLDIVCSPWDIICSL